MNKTIKYNYLFPKPCANSKELNYRFPLVIKDYNELRPHGRLMYQTPIEAFMNINNNIEHINESFLNAFKNRMLINKKNACRQCFALV